jgi:hypothetical protein
MKLSKQKKRNINKLNTHAQVHLANGTKNIEIMKYMISLNEFEVLKAIALNDNATADVLDQLLSTGYLSVAALLLDNDNTSTKTLKKIISLDFLRDDLNESECDYNSLAEYCHYDYLEIQELLHVDIITHGNVTEELLIDIINETNSEDTLDILYKYNKESVKLNSLIQNKKDWLIELEDRENALDYALELLEEGEYVEAYNIIEPAAKNGDHHAQYILAGMYENGYFLEKSIKRTLYWGKKSAEGGYVPAMLAYSMTLLHNKTYTNRDEAVKYIYKAYESDYDEAINYLDTLDEGVHHAA